MDVITDTSETMRSDRVISAVVLLVFGIILAAFIIGKYVVVATLFGGILFGFVLRPLSFICLMLVISSIAALTMPGYVPLILNAGIIYYAAAVLYRKRTLLAPSLRQYYKPIAFFLAAFSLAGIAAWIGGRFNGDMLRQNINWIFCLAFVWMLVQIIDTWGKYRAIYYSLILGAALVALVVLSQWGFNVAEYAHKAKNVKLLGETYNTNFIAMLIAPVIVMAFNGLIGRTTSLAELMLNLLLLIPGSVVILISRSRGGWLAVMYGIAFVLWNQKSKVRKLVLIALLAVIALTYGSVVIMERLQSTTKADYSILYRFYMWFTALKVIQSHVLFGVGIDAFKAVKFQYGFQGIIDPGRQMSSHNIFLELLLDFGAIGFIAFMTLIGKLLTSLQIAYRTFIDHRNGKYILGVSAAMQVYFIHSLFDCGLANFSLLILLMSFIGLAMILMGLTTVVTVDEGAP